MPRKAGKQKLQAAEADKENVAYASEGPLRENDVVPKATGKGKAAASRKVTPSLADELEEMTKKMNTISLEKEKAELLLKEREHLLQERDAQIEEKNAAELRLHVLLGEKDEKQKKLAEKVRKLQKIREFQPNVDLPVKASTRDLKKVLKHMKRPQTPFVRWAKEHREQVKKDRPEATVSDIGKILMEKWKTVGEEEKKPFQERHKMEKDVYLKIVGQEKRDVEALKIYEEEHNKKVAADLLDEYLRFKSEEDSSGGKKKKKRDPSKPKKPTSAFFAFSNERRPKMLAENLKIPEIGKKLGEEWKCLDENRREPYEKVAAEDKLRYATELEAYKLKKAEELAAAEELAIEEALIHKAQGMQLLKEREQGDDVKNTKEEKPKKKRAIAEPVDPNKPKKPLSSYAIYAKDNRKLVQQEKPGASSSEVTATLALRWQELPEVVKQGWEDKGAAARESYKAAMEEYNRSQSLVTVS